MQYRGYVAEIAYDESVDLLHGHVVNAGPYPIATFEASDVEGLKREFETSIEVYLTACKEDGVEPVPPFSGEFILKIGPQLHHKVTIIAMEDGLSVNDWIKRTLEEKLSGPPFVWNEEQLKRGREMAAQPDS
jgi:predicted HicB family RNase H-like nuclease